MYTYVEEYNTWANDMPTVMLVVQSNRKLRTTTIMSDPFARSTMAAPTESTRICSRMNVGLIMSPMLARNRPMKTFLTYSVSGVV
jgi:hypothetical protein